jgi:hypothetical protein
MKRGFPDARRLIATLRKIEKRCTERVVGIEYNTEGQKKKRGKPWLRLTVLSSYPLG